MSEISKLIAEIKSEGILRAGNKLEQLYSLAEQMETDYAALQQKLDAMADKLARSEDWSAGVDHERMEYIEKCNALAAENAALKQVFVTKEFSTEVTDVFSDTVVLKIDGDEHHCHQWVDNDSDVIRAVLASIKSENPTPATDAYLNSVRAEGADAVASYHKERFEFLANTCREVSNKHKEAYLAALDVACELRSGTHDTADKAG